MKYYGKGKVIIDRMNRDIGNAVVAIMEREGVEAKDLDGYTFATSNGLQMKLKENSVQREQRLRKRR